MNNFMNNDNGISEMVCRSCFGSGCVVCGGTGTLSSVRLKRYYRERSLAVTDKWVKLGMPLVEKGCYDLNDLMITMINLLVRFLTLCFPQTI
jgi:hypothetical protein